MPWKMSCVQHWLVELTRNMNHHRHMNRPGDATITWRYTNRHNLFVALTYFFVSSYFQSRPIKR
jgi:hypothetical protein